MWIGEEQGNCVKSLIHVFCSRGINYLLNIAFLALITAQQGLLSAPVVRPSVICKKTFTQTLSSELTRLLKERYLSTKSPNLFFFSFIFFRFILTWDQETISHDTSSEVHNRLTPKHPCIRLRRVSIKVVHTIVKFQILDFGIFCFVLFSLW